MIVRALDNNGDWSFGKGRNDYKSGKDAIAQSIQTRLSSFLGDCFFDITAGIDWFNLLGAKSQLAIQLAASAVILNTKDVASILSLSVVFDRINRNLSLDYKVQTLLGVIEAQTLTVAPNYLLTQSGDILTTEDGDPIIV